MAVLPLCVLLLLLIYQPKRRHHQRRCRRRQRAHQERQAAGSPREQQPQQPQQQEQLDEGDPSSLSISASGGATEPEEGQEEEAALQELESLPDYPRDAPQHQVERRHVGWDGALEGYTMEDGTHVDVKVGGWVGGWVRRRRGGRKEGLVFGLVGCLVGWVLAHTYGRTYVIHRPLYIWTYVSICCSDRAFFAHHMTHNRRTPRRPLPLYTSFCLWLYLINEPLHVTQKNIFFLPPPPPPKEDPRLSDKDRQGVEQKLRRELLRWGRWVGE